MSEIKIFTRSFHPDANFGVMGLGFEGDNRGFKFDPAVTARIYHILPVNLQSGQIGAAICDSDHSENAVAHEVVNAPGNLLEAGWNRFAPQDWQITVPEAPPMQNDYTQPRKNPRHTEDHSITAYRDDGEQSAIITITYAGKNFAFWFADTDLGHAVLGGPNSTPEANNPGTGTINVPIVGDVPMNGLVPDLDVVNQVTLFLNRETEKGYVLLNMSGDGFPNAESFIIDSATNVLGLATHIRTGSAMTQLPGGRSIKMCYTSLTDVDWSKTDILGANVDAAEVTDFMSYSYTSVATGVMSRAALNDKHTDRDASGNILRQIQDHLPLPVLRNYE